MPKSEKQTVDGGRLMIPIHHQAMLTSNINGHHFTSFLTTDAINRVGIVTIDGRKALSQSRKIMFMVGTSTSSDFCSSHLLCVSVGSFSSLFTQG